MKTRRFRAPPVSTRRYAGLVNPSKGAGFLAVFLWEEVNELAVDGAQLVEVLLLNRTLA